MIKGTIAINDFYGRIVSIDGILQNGDIVVNKSTGQQFVVIGANYVKSGFYAHLLVYSIKRKNGTYVRMIDNGAIKKYYWKAV